MVAESKVLPGPVRQPPRRTRHVLRRPATAVVAALTPVAVLIVLWWVLTIVSDRQRIFPPPDVIWGQLLIILGGGGELGTSYMHIAATLYRLGVAFSVAIVLGTVLGVLAGRVRNAFSLLENVIWICMATPSIVWVFIFAVTFGLTDFVPITAVAALLTPGVIINVAEGAKSVPSDIVEMARSYKVTKWQLFRGIYLPFLVPYVAASARVAFALGIKLIVVAEVVGIPNGVGFEIQYWYDQLVMAPMIAWGIVMIMIGFIVDRSIFGVIESRVGRWKTADRSDAAQRVL